MHSVPLAVDLDGTLIEGDSSKMSYLWLLRHSPFVGLYLLGMFLIDRPRSKHEVAKRYVPDVTKFSYIPEVVAYMKEQKKQGRVVVLATASNIAIAKKVAAYLGCFDEVIASDEHTYRGGRGKAKALTDRFGEKGFVYAGNEVRDLPVWEAAGAAILVRVPASVAAIAKKKCTIEKIF